MEQRKQLEQLYREMNDLLKGYAYSRLADWSRAEEAVQETFRIACGKQGILLDSENPKGWLMNTLKGVLRNITRMEARENRLFVQLPELEQLEGEQLDHLPPELLYEDLADTEEYLLIHAVSEGDTVRDLSDRLGVSESACRKRIQRSRKVLQKKIMK